MSGRKDPQRDADEERALALCSRGDALYNAGDYAGALAEFERAAKVAPKLAYAHYCCGKAKIVLEDPAGAQACADRTLALDSRSAHAYQLRAVAKTRFNDYAGALQDMDRALKLNPDLVTTYHSRAWVRYHQGDLEGAIADFEMHEKKASQLGAIGKAAKMPASKLRMFAPAYEERGCERSSRGNLKGAMADFNRAIALDPNFASALANRGSAKHIEGDSAGALADLDRACGLEKDSAQIWFNRGLVRGQTGDMTGALEDFGRAIEIDSDFVDAKVNQSMAQRAGRGDKGTSNEMYQALGQLAKSYRKAGILGSEPQLFEQGGNKGKGFSQLVARLTASYRRRSGAKSEPADEKGAADER